jgi:MFS family permease
MSNGEPGAPDALRSPRPWEAFTFRDYRLLWATGLSVVISRWMRILVTAQWLFDETGSAAQLGLIGGVQLVVQVPALLWGGALADHVNRKVLISIAHSTTFAVLLGLGLLDSIDALSTWHVYAGIALTASTQVISQPASAAMTPSVVPQRYLMLAITTDTATQNAASIVGPLVFAGVAKFAGLTPAFFVAAGMTVPAMVLPLLVRARGRVELASTGSTVRRVWEGFRFVVRHPILPGLFLLDIGITVVSFYREILPVLARGLFNGGAGAVGLLGSANSTGAVAGSFGALFFAGYRSKGMLVLYAALAYAVFLFFFSVSNTLLLGVLAIALIGAADAVTVAVRQTTVQLTTPDHMRGRAYAFLILAAQSANNVGTIWVGFMSDWIGAAETMLLGAGLAFGTTIIIWRVWRPIREYRYP